MRILIVDDDYVSRTKLSNLLAAYGQCDNAPNGEIAVKLFEVAHKELVPYDLITMDIVMPNMTGQDTVQALRAIEKKVCLTAEKETKILMVTGTRSPKDILSSYYEGCNGYLTKPYNLNDVQKALADLGIQA